MITIPALSTVYLVVYWWTLCELLMIIVGFVLFLARNPNLQLSGQPWGGITETACQSGDWSPTWHGTATLMSLLRQLVYEQVWSRMKLPRAQVYPCCQAFMACNRKHPQTLKTKLGVIDQSSSNISYHASVWIVLTAIRVTLCNNQKKIVFAVSYRAIGQSKMLT